MRLDYTVDQPRREREPSDASFAAFIRRWPTLSACVLILVFAILIRGPSFTISVIDPDESAFALAAREVLRGHLPYLTFFDIKPVGSTLLMAASMKILGQDLFAVRVLGLLCVWVAGLLIFRLAAAMRYSWSMSLAAAVLYVSYSATMHGLATMTEIMLAPFTIGAVLCLIRARRAGSTVSKLSFVSLSGLLVGLAVLIKIVPAAPGFLVFGAYILGESFKPDRRVSTILMSIMLFSAMSLLPMLLAATSYWINGEWNAFAYANFGFAGDYIDVRQSINRILIQLLKIQLPLLPLLIFSTLSIINHIQQHRFSNISSAPILLLLWAAGEYIASTASLKFFPHYFLMTLPPLCLLCTDGLRVFLSLISGGYVRARATIALALLIAAIPIAETAKATWPPFITQNDVGRSAAAEISRAASKPQPTIFVISQEMIALYLLADANLPTRFAQPVQLLVDHPSLVQGDPRAELHRVLKEIPPEFIIVNRATLDDRSWSWTRVSAELGCCYVEVANVKESILIDDYFASRDIDIVIYQKREFVRPSSR